MRQTLWVVHFRNAVVLIPAMNQSAQAHLPGPKASGRGAGPHAAHPPRRLAWTPACFHHLSWLIWLGLLLVIELGSLKAQVLALSPKGQPGPCSVAQWKQDWPGCEFEDGVREGHLQIQRLPSGELAWRVLCQAGRIGPEQGGSGWRWPLPMGGVLGLRLSYDLRFEEGFEFVKGGKLPGLCGGPKTITGGEHCSGFEGWSMRLMWRRDGRAQAYVYHPRMPKKYGEEFDFPSDFRFIPGQTQRIEIELRINSIGSADGSLRVRARQSEQAPWKLLLHHQAMEWTRREGIAIDSLLWNIFHGGNDSSWAPQQTCALTISALQLEPLH